LRDDHVGRRADRLSRLQVAQGDEHIVLRMHPQCIGYERLSHPPMVTGSTGVQLRVVTAVIYQGLIGAFP
jgi:hypothetical protein